MEKYKNSSYTIEERTEDLISRMTLEEKVYQTLSFAPKTKYDEGELIENGKVNYSVLKKHYKNSVGGLQLPFTSEDPLVRIKYINQIQKFLLEETRLQIPIMIQEECLHGHLAYAATVFPSPLALASTWDTELVNKIYNAIALEARSRGGHEAHTPVVDIARDPRWGRIEETYGEDTYLVTQMGISAVKGLQGTDENNKIIDNRHIISATKHFVGYGQSDGGRNFAPTNITSRQLHDEILPPFKAAVKEAKALGIMPSHSILDGIPCHANEWLLTDLLRKEWGFKGMVVSDYFDAERLLIFYNVVNNIEEAAKLAIKAGLDMDLPKGSCYINLIEATKKDPAIEKYIDIAVYRILRLKFMLGLFDNPYQETEMAKKYINCKEHKDLARKAAQSAITLLKNNNHILPLDKSKINKIAVIGPTSHPICTGGYSTRPNKGISILDGIKTFVGDEVEIAYATGCNITRERAIGEIELDASISSPTLFEEVEEKKMIKETVSLVEKSDVAVICVGGNDLTSREASYFSDNRGDRGTLDLVGQQNLLVKEAIKTKTPCIVVLINGGPLSITKINDLAQAILECWYLGEKTGDAIASVIFGEVNPSGKLPVTVPRSVGHLPAYYSQKKAGLYKKYLFEDSTPLYPFGYGLSYTTFEYSNLEIEITNDEINKYSDDKTVVAKVLVDITNTGEYFGDEIAQMYISDVACSVVRPAIELKGFKRISLEVNETKTVIFNITTKDLSFTNKDNVRIVEEGQFDIFVGSNLNDTIKKSFVLDRHLR